MLAPQLCETLSLNDTSSGRFDGWRLVVCQPINLEGEDDGTPIVAIDPYGSGMHQRVIVSSDGLAARKAVGDNRSPVRMMITGIIDRMEEEKTA